MLKSALLRNGKYSLQHCCQCTGTSIALSQREIILLYARYCFTVCRKKAIICRELSLDQMGMPAGHMASWRISCSVNQIVPLLSIASPS